MSMITNDFWWNAGSSSVLQNIKMSRSLFKIHPKTDPQLGQRLCLMAKQHKIPRGKKKMAQQTPRHVKSSSSTPTCGNTKKSFRKFIRLKDALVRPYHQIL